MVKHLENYGGLPMQHNANSVLQLSLNDLAERVPNGSKVVLPPDYSFVPMAATRAIITNKARKLHLVAAPQTGLQADLLIGAGCVSEIEAAAVSLGELGNAPRFTAAVNAGTLSVKDSTCPAIHASLQASEKGIPFIPLRGIIGSDLVANRPDWKTYNNPFQEKGLEDPIILLPPIRPDIAIFHSPFADNKGNVWIGRRRELALMAHASKKTFVTVEKIREIDLMESEETSANALPSLYIDSITVCRRGAWPLGLGHIYPPDNKHLKDYSKSAKTEEGFDDYLKKYVLMTKTIDEPN